MSQSTPNANIQVHLDSLGKQYGQVSALQPTNLVFAGETVALLGRNGAGKTTLLDLVSGIAVPSQGSVMIGGHHAGSAEACEQLARQFEVADGAGFLDAARLARLLRFHDHERDVLAQLLRRFDVEGSKMGKMSRGNQLKLALAAAFARSRSVLLLDEPASGLDVFGVAVLAQLIAERRSKGQTTILATHQPSLVSELFDRVLVIELGRILYDGSLDDLMTPSETDITAMSQTSRLAAAMSQLIEEGGS